MTTITVHRAEMNFEDGISGGQNIEEVLIFKENGKVYLGMWLDMLQTEIEYQGMENDIITIEEPFATFVVNHTEDLLHELFINSQTLIKISQL